MNGPAPATSVAAPRQRSALVALFAALALALTSLGAIAPSAASAPSAAEAGRMLVTAAGSVDDAVAAIVEAGGTIVNRFDVFGIVVADVANADALERDGRIAAVAPDVAIAPQWDDTASADAYEDDGGSSGVLAPPSYTAGATIRANDLHATHDGSGIGVAVIDTGIANNPLLQGKVVASADTSTTPNGRDGLGHGTFMAGLIAGQGEGHFTGVAPGAHLVDIKVANADGRATVSGLIAGLAAAHKAKDDFGVRVVLLAAGARPADAGEAGEALVRSLEQLWGDGLVVVVPAGNDPSYVATPGISPYLITAGAIDDNGSAATHDDAAWDKNGGSAAATTSSKPDVLAPGVSLVSTRAAGSTADAENPASRIGGTLFRGTGTSMAAAVTAGAAALLLDAQEDLTPDQVKTKLVTAAHAKSKDRVAGTLDVKGALQTKTNKNVNGKLPAIEEIPDQNLDDDPVMPPNGHSWVGHSWVGHSWVGHSWVGHSWVDDSWVGHSWVGHSWVGHSWVGHSWVGHSWVGYNWQGTSWV